MTSYFHFGLAESVAENPLSRRGVPTHLRLHRARPLAVSLIMGVVPISSAFDQVRTVVSGPEGLVFHAASGARVTHRVDLRFLT